ncbi:hypothetical protein VNO80_11887 [Phaseolus coccineus]|uniref:Uncharacterized protein n=1 Tax=Phaseolus coccineus TaxID=3886 RepID=A0AAN9NBD3_PHACN
MYFNALTFCFCFFFFPSESHPCGLFTSFMPFGFSVVLVFLVYPNCRFLTLIVVYCDYQKLYASLMAFFIYFYSA